MVGFTVRCRVSDSVVGRDDGVRIRLDIEEPVGVPAKLFAYRMLPLNANTGQALGHFSHVCSPVDIAEYPEDAPGPEDSPPWFRLEFVDVLVRSWAEADNFKASVLSDLRKLKTTIVRVQTLLPGEAVRIGDPV